LLIAKALALTERIIFATGITLLPLHHPVDTAHRIAMLDHMARGRFYWGIGVRSIPTDLQLYGITYDTMDDVREQGKEALEVILGLWQAGNGRFDYDGKYYQVHAPEAPPELERRLYFKPYQHPHPPIGVAASSPNSDTIRMAGERGWIPMTNLMAASHRRPLEENGRQRRQRGKAGRSPPVAHRTGCGCRRDASVGTQRSAHRAGAAL
jgi:alkanesulfonate monooxygenase SsuD/methylene tetrahydromethanopterin reductase-like flavin-dependent oxidoreductase (luciferase family)